MFFLLSYLIFQGAATVSFKDAILTVTDQGAIASGDVSGYKDQTEELVISYDNNVEIRNSAFNGFTKLTTISIKCLQLTIKASTFDECSSITTLSIDTQNLDIAPGVFSSTNSLTVNYKGSFFNVAMAEFITSKIKTLNIDVTGECAFGFDESTNSYIEEIHTRANTISFVENCFKNAKGIQIIELNALQSVTFDTGTFINSQVKEIYCYATDSIELFSSCFKSISGTTNVNLQSAGSILIGSACFEFAEIENVDIKSVGDIVFSDTSLQSAKNLNKLTIETEGNCEAKMNSFQNSVVHEILIKSGKATSFEQGSFQGTADLRNLTIISNGAIEFKINSFTGSKVKSMNLYTNDKCTFVEESFKNSIDLGTLTVHVTSDVLFGLDSFLNSQIHELKVLYEGIESRIYLDTEQQSTVTFIEGSFKNCNQLSTVTINGYNVDIQSNSFKDSKSLALLNVNAKEKATIRSNAFSGCTALSERNIEAREQNIASDAFPKSEENKGHKSSSNKDDDDDKSSAKTLGNIDINTVYLGTSPNIVLNLNFILSFFRKIRKTFGHVVPPPDLIHSAIWVSKDRVVTDESLGAIFVYGRYFNKKNSDAFLNNDGAKAYVVTLKQFKEKYPAIEPMKIIPHRKLKLFDFINKVKENGNWGVNDYNWPTNNCQHFTAKLIDILEATRDVQKNDDWIELPKQVINSLELNERKRD